MLRCLVLVTSLVLALGPSLSLAGSQQGGGQCIVRGTYLGYVEESPDSQAVVVQYLFPIPAGEALPMDLYATPVSVFVAEGVFELRVEEVEGDANVRRVRVLAPGEIDEEIIDPGNPEASDIVTGDVVFHPASRYQYFNPSEDENGVLLVSVPISRDAFDQAGGYGPEPVHEKICEWCKELAEDGATPISSAKRIPGINCRGG